MDEVIIENFNSVVGNKDITIHGGDFTLAKKEIAGKYIKQLNGEHIFLQGSHDRWLSKNAKQIWNKTIEDRHVVVCHYAMRVWHRSHFNSWQLYGHSHGKLDPVGKQWDVGVDNNGFYPLSFEDIELLMKVRPNNFNLLKR